MIGLTYVVQSLFTGVALVLAFVLMPSTRLTVPKHHPRVFHHRLYWFNDSLAGIRRAARRWRGRPRYWFIDQDAQVSSDGVVFIKHWPLPHRDGFRWLWTGEYVGRGRFRREKRVRDPHPHVPLSHRPWREISRLRSRRVGRSRRYLTAREHMIECRRRRLTMCLEAKGSPGFLLEDVWDTVADDAAATGCDVIVMTLMKGPTRPSGALARLRGASRAGLPTVLLVHGWAKPDDWRTAWAPYVDEVWGWWA